MLRALFEVLRLEAQIVVVLLRIVLTVLTWVWSIIDRHQKTIPSKPHPSKPAQVESLRTPPIKTGVVTPPLLPKPKPPAINPDVARILGNPDGRLYIAASAFMTEHPRSAELLEKVEHMTYAARHRNIAPWELPVEPEAIQPEPEPIPLPEPDGRLWIATSEGFRPLEP